MKKQTMKTLILFLLISNTIFAQWSNLNFNQNVNSIIKINNKLIVGSDNSISYKLDNSTNWVQASNFSTISTDFYLDGNNLYTSSYEKLYKSTDFGNSWTPQTTIYTYQNVKSVIFSGSNYIAGMDGSGIHFSDDNGINWWDSSSSWQSHNTDIIKIGNTLYASYRFSGYLQASNTDGLTWFTPSCDGIKIGSSSSFQDINALAQINNSILIAGTKNSASYSSYDGVYFSFDNANNFEKRINGLSNTAINTITTFGNLIFVGTNGGVFYSSDLGFNWHSLNTNLTDLNVNKLLVNKAILYAGTSTNVFEIDICNLMQNTSSITSNDITNINSGETLDLVANSDGINYIWYKDNIEITDNNTNILTINEEGDYYVIIEYSSSCSDTSNTISITQTLNIDNIERGIFSIYPNPSNSQIIVENIKNENIQYKIYDINGKMIFSGLTYNKKTEIDISKLNNGMYFIKLNNLSYKFIKK